MTDKSTLVYLSIYIVILMCVSGNYSKVKCLQCTGKGATASVKYRSLYFVRIENVTPMRAFSNIYENIICTRQ